MEIWEWNGTLQFLFGIDGLLAPCGVSDSARMDC
jgi:hypothetical protein